MQMIANMKLIVRSLNLTLCKYHIIGSKNISVRKCPKTFHHCSSAFVFRVCSNFHLYANYITTPEAPVLLYVLLWEGEGRTKRAVGL